MHYRIALALPSERYEQLLMRGWRRFGRTLFRPVCRECSECRSLRVDLSDFRPSKSQRRARNRNTDLEVVVQRPTLTDEHIQLYNDYHSDMHKRRGWPLRAIDESEYFDSFLDGDWEFAREIQYRKHGKLMALGIVDMTNQVMSSIYFIHHPSLREQSIGTASVLKEAEIGQKAELKWLYLGYYIRECGSMSYKSRYRSHQLLQEYVADDVQPIWLPNEDG